MTDDQHLKLCAEAEKDKTVLHFGMVGIVDEQGIFVHENSLGFFE